MGVLRWVLMLVKGSSWKKKDVRDDVVEASGRRAQKKKAGSGVPGRSCVRRRVLGPLVASSPYPKGQQGVRREAKKNTKLADKPDIRSSHCAAWLLRYVWLVSQNRLLSTPFRG
jgi:hypothetical protein